MPMYIEKARFLTAPGGCRMVSEDHYGKTQAHFEAHVGRFGPRISGVALPVCLRQVELASRGNREHPAYAGHFYGARHRNRFRPKAQPETPLVEHRNGRTRALGLHHRAHRSDDSLQRHHLGAPLACSMRQHLKSSPGEIISGRYHLTTDTSLLEKRPY